MWSIVVLFDDAQPYQQSGIHLRSDFEYLFADAGGASDALFQASQAS